jgi:hypothetical protein
MNLALKFGLTRPFGYRLSGGLLPDGVYFQPDGASLYLQPDGSSFYLQP